MTSSSLTGRDRDLISRARKMAGMHTLEQVSKAFGGWDGDRAATYCEAFATARGLLGPLADLAEREPDTGPDQTRALVIQALHDGASYLYRQAADRCEDCECAPDGACDVHVAGLDQASRYEALARQLQQEDTRITSSV